MIPIDTATYSLTKPICAKESPSKKIKGMGDTIQRLIPKAKYNDKVLFVVIKSLTVSKLM